MRNHSKQRDVVLEILRNSFSHPTADEIFEEAKTKLPQISLGTVYRNLDELVKSNIVKKISTPASKDCYDLPKSHHCHATCQTCGKVIDISVNEQIEKTCKQVYSQCKLESSPDNIIIIGICKECQTK